MKFDDLPFVLKFCAVALRKYADFLKDMDADNDTSDLSTWYEHIESYGGDFDSMTLKDLDACLHGSYWHLCEFVDMLKEDDDSEWLFYELLLRVLDSYFAD